MEQNEIYELLSAEESISLEFKDERVRSESIAREMVSMANTLGGVILLGVQDDVSVSGLSGQKKWEEWVHNIARTALNPSLSVDINLLTIDEKVIMVLEVPKGKDKPYQTVHDGKYWIRAGSTVRQATKEELSRLFQSAGLVHFDISGVNRASWRDLDQAKLSNYFSNVYDLDYRSTEDAEQKSILKNSSILVDDGEGLVPSVGGVLLFSKAPQNYLPHASISIAVINGTELTDEVVQKKEIGGVLPEQVDDTLGFLLLHVPEPLIVDDSPQRKDTLAIDRKVLREVLVNAVCHRDYSMAHQKTRILLFKDRIEVCTPGRIANTLTLEMIRYGNSAPRNIFLVKLMDNLRYIDGLGRGIPLIIKLMGDRVRFKEVGDRFCVELFY